MPFVRSKLKPVPESEHETGLNRNTRNGEKKKTV